MNNSLRSGLGVSLLTALCALAGCSSKKEQAQDLSVVADLATGACAAQGGHCLNIEDDCEAAGGKGNAVISADCNYLCCVPAPACSFACDGGACACSTSQDQHCNTSGGGQCLCSPDVPDAGAQAVWVCPAPT